MNHLLHIGTVAILAAGFTCARPVAISEGVPSDAATPIVSDTARLLPEDPRVHARAASRSRTIYTCLERLWTLESNWNPRARNKHSSAFGIAQMLHERSKDPLVQVDHGMRYIKERYGDACRALAHEYAHGWY